MVIFNSYAADSFIARCIGLNMLLFPLPCVFVRALPQVLSGKYSIWNCALDANMYVSSWDHSFKYYISCIVWARQCFNWYDELTRSSKYSHDALQGFLSKTNDFQLTNDHIDISKTSCSAHVFPRCIKCFLLQLFILEARNYKIGCHITNCTAYAEKKQ